MQVFCQDFRFDPAPLPRGIDQKRPRLYPSSLPFRAQQSPRFDAIHRRHPLYQSGKFNLDRCRLRFRNSGRGREIAACRKLPGSSPVVPEDNFQQGFRP